MHRHAKSWILLAAIAALCQTAEADTFGNAGDNFDIEFVTIGNPGNTADPTGFPKPAGTVAYTYRMGKYEISEPMITVANTIGGLGIFQNAFGENSPTTLITWNSAARFVNWLNASQGFHVAYKFELQPGDIGYVAGSNIELWPSTAPGFDASNLFRNSLAKYFLPSENEWYKAAYYDPSNGVYYDYPTGSDSVPDGIDFLGDTEFDAVFVDAFNLGAPKDVTDVGAASSPYGTFGQGGNVWEMLESAFLPPNDLAGESRVTRGGAWNIGSTFLRNFQRIGGCTLSASGNIGFRVARRIPVPGDSNGNGVVDAADYTVWRDSLGQTGPGLAADFDGNMVVDQLDYDFWKARFGNTSGSASGGTTALGAVPEPHALTLLALATLGLLFLHRTALPIRRQQISAN